MWVTLAVSERRTRGRLDQIRVSSVVEGKMRVQRGSEIRRTKVNVRGESDVQATTTERAGAASEVRMRCCQGRPGPVDKINCLCAGESSALVGRRRSHFFKRAGFFLVNPHTERY
jgi:hypothetical protein